MDLLKSACEDELTSKINVNSVVSILILADKHTANNLKSKCIDFITTNATEVMLTKAFENMAKTKPNLMIEICRHLAVNVNSNEGPPAKRIRIEEETPPK